MRSFNVLGMWNLTRKSPQRIYVQEEYANREVDLDETEEEEEEEELVVMQTELKTETLVVEEEEEGPAFAHTGDNGVSYSGAQGMCSG